MKTFFKDYSIEGTTLVDSCSDLEHVISNRQYKFSKTVEYDKTKTKVQELLGSLKESYPEAKEIIRDLDDAVVHLECICFSTAYRDGMSDLMTAMTFNKLELTKTEYVNLKGA